MKIFTLLFGIVGVVALGNASGAKLSPKWVDNMAMRRAIVGYFIPDELSFITPIIIKSARVEADASHYATYVVEFKETLAADTPTLKKFFRTVANRKCNTAELEHSC